jgi:chorismate synthase
MLQYTISDWLHKEEIVIIIDGMPSNLCIDTEKINEEFIEYQSGLYMGKHGRGNYPFQIDIISGLDNGITTNKSIILILKYRDIGQLEELTSFISTNSSIPRPGCGDFGKIVRYKDRYIKEPVEYSLIKEMSAKVAIGAIARIFLNILDIEVISHVVQIGKIKADVSSKDLDEIKQRIFVSLLRCVDKNAEQKMFEIIQAAAKTNDTLGGTFEILAKGIPPGLGNEKCGFRLDGRIAQKLIDIPYVRGVEIGTGFEIGELYGSEAYDILQYSPDKGLYYATNKTGGIEYGLTNGNILTFKAVVAALPPLRNPMPSVDLKTNSVAQTEYERVNVCIIPSISVVGEAIVAIELSCIILERFGNRNMDEIRKSYTEYIHQVGCIQYGDNRY